MPETTKVEPDGPDDHFGLCPECHQTDGYLNAGRGHWFVCDAHRAIWFVGSNLFSSWRDESELEQRRAWRKVESYREVKPWRRDVLPQVTGDEFVVLDDDDWPF